jgi:hypothetical protein
MAFGASSSSVYSSDSISEEEILDENDTNDQLTLTKANKKVSILTKM